MGTEYENGESVDQGAGSYEKLSSFGTPKICILQELKRQPFEVFSLPS